MDTNETELNNGFTNTASPEGAAASVPELTEDDTDVIDDYDPADGFFSYDDLADLDEESGDEQAEEPEEEDDAAAAGEEEAGTQTPAQEADGQESDTDGVEPPDSGDDAPSDTTAPDEPDGNLEAPDYAAWEREDIAGITEAHPELAEALKGKKLSALVKDPRRFAELRGDPMLRGKLSVADALLIAGGLVDNVQGADTPPANSGAPAQSASPTAGSTHSSKSHLRPGPNRPAQPAVSVPREIKLMRDRGMFGDNVSDAELLELYRNVT